MALTGPIGRRVGEAWLAATPSDDPRRQVVVAPESAGIVCGCAGPSAFLAGEQTSFVRIGRIGSVADPFAV